MQCVRRFAFVVLLLCGAGAVSAGDWTQFRGPGGQGISAEKNLPTEWSSTKNVVWKTKLPGPGTSSPVTLGERVFVTCYSGYGVGDKKAGEKQEDLKRHILCVDEKNGSILWSKVIEPALPEHTYYQNESDYHGYAASTPTTDGERLYVFFGKTGVYCFDLDGKQLWQASVGKNTRGWGSGASPILYKNLLIVNASVESGSLIALDKMTGKEVWKAPGMSSAWNTPVLVTAGSQEPELVISVDPKVRSFNPDTGKELWNAEGVHRYVCPSVVAHDGVIYATGGGHTTLAVKTGGNGDVTKTHTVWYDKKKGSNVGSPIFYAGHLYWASDGGGMAHCQEAATGKYVYSERLMPPSGQIWASPVLADGKLYYVSKYKGTYVVAAQPKFEQLAHNTFDDDKSRTNSSIAVSNGQLLLRTDEYLYCIGKR